MPRIARVLKVCALAVTVLGCAAAQGSFSAQFKPVPPYLDMVVEQKIADLQGGVLYGGSGFAVSAENGIERLTPYTMWCREQELVIAYGEVCMELEAPLIGDGDYVSIYFNVVW